MDFGFESFDSTFSDFDVDVEEVEVKKTKKFDRLWKVGVGGSINNTPTIHKGVVYFGSYDGYVYAVNADTMEEVWKFKCGRSVSECTPHVEGNAVYFGSFDTYFYSVDILTGKEIWRFKTGGEIDVSPVIHNGSVIFVSRDSYAYCLNFDGTEKWRFKAGDEIGAAPGAYGTMVFVPCFDGYIYCVNFETGKEIWRFKTGSEIHHTDPLMVHEGVLYCGSFDNYLYAIDVNTGKEIWGVRTGKYGNASIPAFLGDRMYYPSRDGVMYCLNKRTGNEIWRVKTGADDSVNQHPIIINNVLYFCAGNDLYALDPSNGKELWKVRTGGVIFTSPRYYNGKLYFGNWDCHLYVINIETRDIVNRFTTSTTQEATLPPAFNEFKVEIKITTGQEDIPKDDRYKSKNEQSISLSDYHVKSDYATTSEYKQKSDYDTSFVMFEQVFESNELIFEQRIEAQTNIKV